jgi:hypothetical protein
MTTSGAQRIERAIRDGARGEREAALVAFVAAVELGFAPQVDATRGVDVGVGMFDAVEEDPAQHKRGDPLDHRNVERQIKGWSRTKMQALIDRNIADPKRLSKARRKRPSSPDSLR